LIACVVLVLVAAAPLRAQRKFDEREVKATFLFNFAQFVEWPAERFADPRAPFVIGVLGDDSFATLLAGVVSGEMIKNRPFVVTPLRAIDDLDVCHILVVGASAKAQYKSIVDALQGRAILTVGDADGFTASGGMIRFLTENRRVRLRINLGAVRNAGLTISSQLLRIAEVVGDGAAR
jgi:hypothetical protein